LNYTRLLIGRPQFTRSAASLMRSSHRRCKHI